MICCVICTIFMLVHDRYFQVVLSECIRHIYISVMRGPCHRDTYPSFNTRILCNKSEFTGICFLCVVHIFILIDLMHILDALQMLVIDGPHLCVELNDSILLYFLGSQKDSTISSSNNSFSQRSHTVLPKPKVVDNISLITVSQSVHTSQRQGNGMKEKSLKYSLNLASSHCFHVLSRNICLLRFHISLTTEAKAGNVACGWFWLAIDLSSSIVTHVLECSSNDTAGDLRGRSTDMGDIWRPVPQDDALGKILAEVCKLVAVRIDPL